MKIKHYICNIPCNITPESLVELAERLSTCEGYENFECENDCIFGVREETESEQESRIQMENAERHAQAKKEQEHIEAVLAKNPGVVYTLECGKVTKDCNIFDSEEAKKALALAMTNPGGVFTKNGKVVEWSELKHF